MSPKLLIVNNSPLLARFIRNLALQVYPQAEVHQAHRGREAVVTAIRTKPNLIFLDWELPDLSTEAVADELLLHEETAATPVVITHRATQTVAVPTRLTNIKHLLPKPFRPEELLQILDSALQKKTQDETAPSGTKPKARARIPTPRLAPSANILLRGRSDAFPLPAAFQALQDESYTGTLRLSVGREPIQVHFKDGHILFATTRDTASYFGPTLNGASVLPARPLNQASLVQSDTGCPVFITLSKQNILSWAEAVRETHLQGLRLFSQVWTSGKVEYEFEQSQDLPDYAKSFPPYLSGAYQWSLQSMRELDHPNRAPILKLEPDGVPTYTPEGYSRIHNLRLSENESALAGQIDNMSNLRLISARLNLGLGTVRRELEKFVLLEIADFWSPSVLGIRE
ncbi:MAG: response regulator [Verrucomicrobiales bacterium]